MYNCSRGDKDLSLSNYLSLETAKLLSNAFINSQSIYLFISFLHLFIYLFIYSFIYLLTGLDVLQKTTIFKDSEDSPQSTKGGNDSKRNYDEFLLDNNEIYVHQRRVL